MFERQPGIPFQGDYGLGFLVGAKVLNVQLLF